MRKGEEVKVSEKCPCESGKRYGSCCKRSRLKWFVDKKGLYYKRIPISSEAKEVLESMREEYHRIFERPPNKKDPVSLLQYLMSEEDVEKEMVKIMEEASVKPEFIYAFHKTGGLLLTDHNKDLATGKDRKDWEDAIDEYFELQDSPRESNSIDLAFSSLETELNACIICTGYVLDIGIQENAKRTPSSSLLFTVDDYVLLCLTKSIKTLRAIKTLIKDNIGSDCLPLVRSIYENYLHSIFAINRPEMLEHLIDAVVGLKTGTHSYAKNKNGRVDARFIIRKCDGVIFQQNKIINYKMAESSNYPDDQLLFDYLYGFLSDYTHPSFTSFNLVLGDAGELDHLSNELQSEAIVFSICFSAMILDQLRRLKCISRIAKSDIKTVTQRIGKKAIQLLECMYADTELPDPFVLLRNRLANLGL